MGSHRNGPTNGNRTNQTRAASYFRRSEAEAGTATTTEETEAYDGG